MTAAGDQRQNQNMATERKTVTMGKVHFEQMPNFRPVYNTQDNGTPSSKPKLFRSSRPDFLAAKDLDSFNALGLKCIIDFRSSKEYQKASGGKLLDLYFPVYKANLPFRLRYKHNQEVKAKPLKLKANHSVSVSHDSTDRRHILIDFFKMNYIWAVFNRASIFVRLYSMVYLIADLILNTGFMYFVRCFARNVLNHSGLGGQYVDMVKYSQASVCAALKILSDERNLPAMINCAHGKDRTGIVSAMVLGVLGKSKEEIAENYALSQTELEPIKSRLHTEIVEKFHMHEEFTRAQPQDIMEALLYIEANYGSIPHYLDSIGFSMEEQERLRQLLLS